MRNWSAACSARAQDSDDVVAARMAKAAGEISHWPEYDYVIINDDLGRTLQAKSKSILDAERLKRRAARSACPISCGN